MNKETGSLNFDEGPNLGRMRCTVALVPAMMPIGGAEGLRIDGRSVSKETHLLLSGRWPDASSFSAERTDERPSETVGIQNVYAGRSFGRSICSAI